MPLTGIGAVIRKHRVFMEFKLGYGLVRVVAGEKLFHIMTKADKRGAKIVERFACETEMALLMELDAILAEYK